MDILDKPALFSESIEKLRAALLSGLFALVLVVWVFPLRAESLVSREEALAAIFPGATFKSERIFLSEKEQRDVAKLARAEVPSALWARYLVFSNGKEIGRAYVDTHVVRTKKESLLICLDEQGNVKRIEVTAFLEPPDYRASSRWYEQYYGKPLSNDLNLQRAIRPIAGATLTATATNNAVRRVLAIDHLLRQNPARGKLP